MNRTIAAFILTAAALAASAAFAENTVGEQQASLDRIQATHPFDRHVSSGSQVSRGSDNFLTRTFGNVTFSFIGADRIEASSGWGENYRGGRVHEPTGQ